MKSRVGFLENPARKSMVLRPEIRTECLPSLEVCFKEKGHVELQICMFMTLQHKISIYIKQALFMVSSLLFKTVI